MLKISVSMDISVLEFYGYIGYIGDISDISDISEIYRIYRRYIDECFYMNIDISEINKNTLKFMEYFVKV